MDKLLEIVKEMRDLQKEYFKTRNKLVLMSAINKEKEVDDMLSYIAKGGEQDEKEDSRKKD